eukprot:gene24013-10123_t
MIVRMAAAAYREHKKMLHAGKMTQLQLLEGKRRQAIDLTFERAWEIIYPRLDKKFWASLEQMWLEKQEYGRNRIYSRQQQVYMDITQKFTMEIMNMVFSDERFNRREVLHDQGHEWVRLQDQYWEEYEVAFEAQERSRGQNNRLKKE